MAMRWMVLALALLAPVAAAGETCVFINNNTGMELEVKTETRLSREYWRQTRTRVPSGQRLEVLRFNRQSGITDGEEFVFRTTVTAGASKFVVSQALRGNWWDSHLWQAVEGDDWSDDREERHATWVMDGRAVPVKYAALSAGTGFDDVGYRFGAPVELPKTAGPVKVLAYNCWMLPTGVVSSIAGCRGHEARAQRIPAQLSGYDALMLSELFDDEIRRKMVYALRREYPFYTGVVGSDGLFSQDGGVLIMSRWPLARNRQMRFGAMAVDSDANSDKGAMYARMLHPHGPIHLVATHTQADYAKARYPQVRGMQLTMVRRFIDELKVPESEPVLIGGDLNVDSAGNPREFERALQLLRAVSPATEGSPYSWDPRANPLASGQPERLDHVLWSAAHRQPRAASCRVVQPRARWSDDPGDPDHLSDHFAVEAVMDFAPGAAAPLARVPAQAGPRGTLLGLSGN